MLSSYLKEGRRMYVKKNTVIYEQGKIGEGFYYIVNGKVKMSMKVFDGKERILEVIENGKTFGELSMDQKCYFSSAVALENSIIYYFEYQQFQELITKDERIRNLFYHSVIHKMKQLGIMVQNNSLSVEEQLANALLRVCGENNTYEIPLNQQELANYAGLTRITVYKITKKWMENNLITRVKDKLYIKCPEVLLEYVRASNC